MTPTCGRPDVPAETLVQRLAHALLGAFPISPALAVVLAFAIAGSVALGVIAGATHALNRYTTTRKE